METDLALPGRPAEISDPQDATDLGIATVYQDLALCDNLTAAANVFLGREIKKRRESAEAFRKSGAEDRGAAEEAEAAALADYMPEPVGEAGRGEGEHRQAATDAQQAGQYAG